MIDLTNPEQQLTLAQLTILHAADDAQSVVDALNGTVTEADVRATMETDDQLRARPAITLTIRSRPDVGESLADCLAKLLLGVVRGSSRGERLAEAVLELVGNSGISPVDITADERLAIQAWELAGAFRGDQKQ